MLNTGGILNIIIAFAHLIGLFWAEQMFEVTGIGKEMAELSETHSSLPYLLTISIAIIFFIFGLYGLSASEKFKELPYLKFGIFLIAGIYLFRGLGELIFDIANSVAETTYSIIALVIGSLFLFGGLKKWSKKKE